MALKEPFYGKTITGFVRSDAWKTVMHGVTLRTKEDKAQFRNIDELKLKPYRVRLNLCTNRLEIHDARNKHQSLHRVEKERRAKNGLTPLPPHQSFTYYDPEDRNFVPHYFYPSSGGQQNEIIGIRASQEGAYINRLLFKDSGTYNVFYGFSTESNAADYLRKIKRNDDWAYSLSDLKAKSNQSLYNEAMVRINWHCDGTSQLVLYPTGGRSGLSFDLAGRYAAMLHRYDLESHLRNNRLVYQKEPFYWKEDYYVPISFWGNKSPDQWEFWGAADALKVLQTGNRLHWVSLKPSLYTLEEQENDLKKQATNLRESILKAALYFMQGKDFPINVVNEFNHHLNTARPAAISEGFKFLDWITKKHGEFIQSLFCLTAHQDNWRKMNDYIRSSHHELYSTLFLHETMRHLTEKEQNSLLTIDVMPQNASMLEIALNNRNIEVANKLLQCINHELRRSQNMSNKHCFNQAKNMILQIRSDRFIDLFLNTIKNCPSAIDPLLESTKVFSPETQSRILKSAYLFAIQSKSPAIEPLISTIFKLENASMKAITKKTRPIHALKKMGPNHNHDDAEKFIAAELSLLLIELKDLVDKYQTASKKAPRDKTLQLVGSETKKLHDALAESVERYKLSKEDNKIGRLISDFSFISKNRHPSIKKYPDLQEYIIKLLAMLTIVYAVYLLVKAPKRYKENKSLFFQSPTEKKLDEFMNLSQSIAPA